ncbi:MAG: hypothetical protein KIT09_22100 [Bryobacteraceae bacterium]|nr:hypothetical protein [Bryobacteraceae bacterium]
MIYHRRRRSALQNAFFRFENAQRKAVYGFGDGDYVKLRDEYGNVWRGQAEVTEDKGVRYLFRDADGKRISGIADRYGVVLRDERGNLWRGYID